MLKLIRLRLLIILVLLSAGQLLAPAAPAQTPVVLTIGHSSTTQSIPPDFSGFSFETGSLRYNHYRTNAYFFDSTNVRLLTLFRNLGIGGLRVGGNSVDRGYMPSHDEMDALFRFARAANIKIIYSLRLANGDALQDASAAKYVWDRYRTNLVCLAIGNEPNSYNGLDREMTNCPMFLAKWNRFADAVVEALPDVKFGGMDNGNGAVAWASAFAEAQKKNRNVVCILAHYEPGGTSRNKSSTQLIEEMLSPGCDSTKYPACYKKLGAMAQSFGFSYRFSEANSHVATPASQGSNHSFATALFALDFLHWWAAHNCMGAYFHTGLAGYNAALHTDENGDYDLYPISYGVAAFNLGGHGRINPVEITNPEGENLTAYAVTDANKNLLVTIINKEHGPGARGARVAIHALVNSGEVTYLKAANNDVTATSKITLGGASMDGNLPWQGQWSRVDATNGATCEVTVEAASAAIIKLAAAGETNGP